MAHEPIAQRCGAKTRGGGTCKQPPMKGKTRCRNHGGASTGPPKGTQNAYKTGVYARFLSEEDRDVGEASEVDNCEAELRVLQIQLARVLKAQKVYDDAAANGEDVTRSLVLTRLSTHTTQTEDSTTGTGENAKDETKSSLKTTTDRVIERPDFEMQIDRFSSRIEKLKRLHAELTGNLNQPGGVPVDADGAIRVKITGGLPD